ncbi:MAG: bifunctional alpha/beta hydrolase/class I SAM-dependent methyltransferase, partial [Rickettsia endosymbiont of Ixodes persulcatus]|nr:bifunctional alpha/beta hydrolase/class I SAM-dependent methyltransferase [Rickettsia endosymbiont of Ixodes persulcatus]
SGKPKGAIVLLHRGHEHGGRVAHLVEELGLGDFAFYAWDARGHGRSPGERGYSPSFAASVRDLDSFVKHISETGDFPVEDIAVIAQSVGAVLAATWVHDYAPPIRAIVLASPAFSVKLYVPFAREGIWLWQKLKGQFFVNSYVKAKFLTHDPARIASFDNDPLITRAIASNILLDLYTNAERVVDDARAITVPTQLLISGSDWVVRHAPQHRFYENLAHPLKERHVLKGFYHDTLGEKDRAIAVAHARRFILEQFEAKPDKLNLTSAHQTGFTRDEQDRLSSPHDLLSLKGLYWALYRASIRFSALFSKGLKTGVETGFDSGSTLDYVYENEPRGMGPGGKLIDRQFLQAIGWRGIRQRKLHLQELIGVALSKLQDIGSYSPGDQWIIVERSDAHWIMGEEFRFDVGVYKKLARQFLPEPDALACEGYVKLDAESRGSEHKRADRRRIIMNPCCRKHGTNGLRNDGDIFDREISGFADMLYKTVEIANRGRKRWRVSAFAGRAAMATGIPGIECKVAKAKLLDQMSDTPAMFMPPVQQDNCALGLA